MYREVEWAVPADPYILEELSKYEGWHTAKNLEINTKFGRQWVSNAVQSMSTTTSLKDIQKNQPIELLSWVIEHLMTILISKASISTDSRRFESR